MLSLYPELTRKPNLTAAQPYRLPKVTPFLLFLYPLQQLDLRTYITYGKEKKTMPTYEYEEEHFRRRRDDHSPEYHSGGGSGQRPPSRPDSPVERMHLEPIPDSTRPRSVPPPGTSMIVRPRSRSRSRAGYSSSSSSSSPDRRRRYHDSGERSLSRRSPSPRSRARSVVDNNFTNSTAGLGAGLLGAVVGGLVAREASEATTRRRHKERGYDPRESESESRTRIVSTILGAVAGGLGANALTNRVEDSRARDRERQQAWERRYGREEDLPHYDTGRPADLDHRNGRGLPAPLPPPPSSTYNDDDDDYDFVYDDPRYDDRRSSSRRRSDENYRYRS